MNTVVKEVIGFYKENGVFYDMPCNENQSHIGKILLKSGEVQTPSWKGLYRYWHYAKPSEIEYATFSLVNEYVLFSFSVACGQGGIHALWNAQKKHWAQVSEANYISCGIFDPTLNAIISLHHVSCWGVPEHHTVYATSITGIRNGFDSGKYFNVESTYKQGKFNPDKYNLIQSGYGHFVENEYGPLGIFLTRENTYFAHDAGNIYKFDRDQIIAKIERLNR